MVISQIDRKVLLKGQCISYQVEMKDISLISCDGYISTVYFINDQKPISVSKLLKDFESELESFGFFRANRNTLINVKNITSFQGSNKRIVTMSNNQKICVSCRKTPILNKILKCI